MFNIGKTVFAALITVFLFYIHFFLDLNYIRPKPQSFRFGKFTPPHNYLTYICHPNYPTRIRSFNWTKKLFETKLNEATDVVKMDIMDNGCPNCFLNASCHMKFDQFYPSVCNISSKNQSLRSCMALDPPILLIGDSRIRMLSWVVHDMYISIENVYSFSKKNLHVEHPDLMHRKRSDACRWHNKHDNFRHKNKYGETILSMLWDPLMSMEDEIVLNEFHSMKDGMQNGFVVVHLGVWAQKIIKETMTESQKQEERVKQLLNRLDHRLRTLKNVSKEVHATLIFLLDPHTDLHPIWFPDFDPPNFNTTSISQWTLSVASKHPEVIIWDSHLHLTNVYRQICRNSCATKGKWAWKECSDIVHPSISVLRQYATMLMNFICHTF